MTYIGDKLNEIVFPVGGIGSGSIGIRGNGQLTDFEIFNRPNKNRLNGYTHFAVRTVTADGQTVTFPETTISLSLDLLY